MEELIQMIVNNGVGVVCVAYLIYFQSTTMKEMLSTLNTIKTEITVIKEEINKHHDENK